jgi:cytochrome c oxidase subunit IV
MSQTEAVNLRVYWITWGVLLVVTLLMLLLDGANVSRTPFLLLMLGAMAVKATLIGGNFMHLRHENAGIVLTVIVGLFACGLILYTLIAPDAVRIHQMVTGQ